MHTVEFRRRLFQAALETAKHRAFMNRRWSVVSGWDQDFAAIAQRRFEPNLLR